MSIDKIKEGDSHMAFPNDILQPNPSAASKLFQSELARHSGLMVQRGSFDPKDVAEKRPSVFVSFGVS